MAILQIPLPPTDNAALVRAWRTWAGLKLRYVKNLETVPVSSPKALEAAEAFGGGLENLRLEVYRGLELEIEPGMVVYVTGESGGGKSLLLRYMAGVMARHSGFAPVAASWEIEVDRDRPLIETVKGGLQRSIGILSAAGLSDLFTWLRPHKMLSDGQKLRHLFALALDRGARTVILDEFCSNLDRETAKATAYTIQKYARRNGLTLVVGTAVDDLLEDLAPDLLVVKHIGPHVEVRRMAG
ncbi:MAG: hypothetical protein QXD32_05180, partial [Nitrososphaerota archaeon]